MTNAIIPGSLQAISQHDGATLAESFLSCDALVVMDMSGSMDMPDTPTGETRRKVATDHLIKLQKNHPGKLALICFADYAIFCPAGLPQQCGGSTKLDRALEYVKVADGAGLKIIIVSDGSPNDPGKCLEIARGFENHLDTIYVGPEDDREGGRAFLAKLASLTGGQSLKSDSPGLLEPSVERLLLT